MGPEEARVVIWSHSYFDVQEQATIFAVPDSNAIFGGCRDSIALWRVFCCPQRIVVAECLHSFSSWNVPDSGYVVIRCRDESSRVGRKSTPLISWESSQCLKTCLCVFASHTNNSPQSVPAAIHLPSLDTARQLTYPYLAPILATCVLSSTRHTRTPPGPPLKRYSPFAENVTAYTSLPTSIPIDGSRCSCRMISINARPILSVPTGHHQSGFQRCNLADQ